MARFSPNHVPNTDCIIFWAGCRYDSTFNMNVVGLASDGFWALVPGNAATTAMTGAAYADAQMLVVVRASRGPEWIELSKKSAGRLLVGYFGSIDSTIAIKWAAPQ